MPIVGLDLGTHIIRGVEMEEQRGHIVLKKYGTYENPNINLQTSSQSELDKYSAALKEFFAQTGFSTPNVSIPLPESEVFTRLVKMPNMSDKELRSSIEFEAEQYIPIPIDEVTFDYQVLDPDPLDRDKMNVLLVAAKKSILSKYVGVLKKAGLIPHALEPESLAVGRLLGDTVNKPSATVVLNIGALDSQIVISYKGSVRFTRSIAMGGEAITKAIEQNLGLDYMQAEEYKKTYGLDEKQAEGKVYEAIKPVYDKMLAEVKRSSIFYTTHNPNVIINRMIVSGGSALMPGLLFYTANNLDLEVELANPWRNIQFSKPLQADKQKLEEQGPMYVTSVGLALKEFKEN